MLSFQGTLHKLLLLDPATPLHAHRCTHSPTHLFILILLFPLTAKIYRSTFSTALHVNKCTHSSVYLSSLFLPFQHNRHNIFWTDLLGYIHTDLPENRSTSLSSCFSFVCCYYFPILSLVVLCADLPFHQTTGSISSFHLACMHTYLSMHLLVCILTDPLENECTC